MREDLMKATQDYKEAIKSNLNDADVFVLDRVINLQWKTVFKLMKGI